MRPTGFARHEGFKCVLPRPMDDDEGPRRLRVTEISR